MVARGRWVSVLAGGLASGMVLAGAIWPGQLAAQFRPGMKPDLPRLEASGTVEMVGPQGLQITSTAGEVWNLFVSPKCTVEVTGTAKADVLRPGLTVAFTAEVDKRLAKVTEPVKKMLIFSPSPERQLGVFPDQGLGGLGQNVGAEPALPHTGRRGPGPPQERFEVRGTISGVTKTGKFTLFVPNPYFKPSLQFEVAEDVAIDLELTGHGLHTMAKKGDKVAESTGVVLSMAPNNNAGRVDHLKLELAEPYTTVVPKKQPPAHPAAPRTKRPGGEPQPEPEQTPPEKPAKEPRQPGEPPGPGPGAGEPPKPGATKTAPQGANP